MQLLVAELAPTPSASMSCCVVGDDDTLVNTPQWTYPANLLNGISAISRFTHGGKVNGRWTQYTISVYFKQSAHSNDWKPEAHRPCAISSTPTTLVPPWRTVKVECLLKDTDTNKRALGEFWGVRTLLRLKHTEISTSHRRVPALYHLVLSNYKHRNRR